MTVIEEISELEAALQNAVIGLEGAVHSIYAEERKLGKLREQALLIKNNVKRCKGFITKMKGPDEVANLGLFKKAQEILAQNQGELQDCQVMIAVTETKIQEGKDLEKSLQRQIDLLKRKLDEFSKILKFPMKATT